MSTVWRNELPWVYCQARPVAPSMSYGDISQPRCGGGQNSCGTTGVDAATLIGSVRDAVRECGGAHCTGRGLSLRQGRT